MIFERGEMVPPAVSAGLNTLAVRMPEHEAARSLIGLCGFPLAAPSANVSGRPSPTLARHVLEDLDGVIDAVLDGGPCAVGIESTVLDMTGERPCILRPGAISLEMVEAVCQNGGYYGGHLSPDDGQAPRSPGMKYRHYAPSVPVLAFAGPPEETFERLRKEAQGSDGILYFSEYEDRLPPCKMAVPFGKSYDKEEQNRRLFSALRELELGGAARILAQCPRDVGSSRGVFDRLKRAASGGVIESQGPKVIGVTGRSGSGKSLFCQTALALGGAVIDADAVYARLLRESREMNRQLYARFPAAFSNDAFNRRLMSQIAFSDVHAHRDLNQITHAFVGQDTKRQIERYKAQNKHVFLDVPLLFESGFDRICDVNIGIVASDALLLERIMRRDGLSLEQAQMRLSSQQPTSFFEKRCDVIIENRGDISDFIQKSQNVCHSLL